jgi:hypothetical protein
MIFHNFKEGDEGEESFFENLYCSTMNFFEKCDICIEDIPNEHLIEKIVFILNVKLCIGR